MKLFELALSMEYDLRNFYQNQADLHKENSLHTVFILLMEEEGKHAEILKSHEEKMAVPLTDSNLLANVHSIFDGIKNFNSLIKDIPSQLDVYRMALEKEEESKKFYQNLCSEAAEEESRKIFGYLIQQEDIHCIILEELIKRVSRPEEWVESAEFGIREEY